MTDRLLDQIIVVDVESTCWEGPPPPGQQSEIIEIGVCLLDVASGKRSARRSMIVRPVYSKVSDFCSQLTTLTQAQVEAGMTFQEACDILRNDYASLLRPWASFGNYDRNQFARQCRLSRVFYPFSDTHINVKNLFTLVHQLPEEPDLPCALKMMGMEFEGTYHRGDSDAWNVAALLGGLLQKARRDA